MNEPQRTPDDADHNGRHEGRIALWPGRHREDGDNQPYLTGRFTLNGAPYFVTLWKRNRESERQPILSGNVTLAIDDKLEV